MQLPGVKVSRNAQERRSGAQKFKSGATGCKIIWFHSRNVRSWAQQVNNLRYSNPTVNKSFNFHILRS